MESLFLAYSLSGVAGLRSSLAILAVAIAAHTGYLHPDPSLAWVGSWWLILLALAAAVVEFVGDKIPLLDHALHAIHFVLAPVAGAIAAMSGYHGDPAVDVVLAILGGGNALFIHTAKAGVRGVATMATVGTANPFISLAEDGLALFLIIVAIVAPWLTALILIILTFKLVRKLTRRREVPMSVLDAGHEEHSKRIRKRLDTRALLEIEKPR